MPSSPLSLKPSPLVLRPGPIYAEDGDRGINQAIIYSIFSGEWGPALNNAPYPSLSLSPSPPWAGEAPGAPASKAELAGSLGLRGPGLSTSIVLPGNVNGTFVIHPDSGNLTMARSVPSAMTFLLLVKVRWGPARGAGQWGGRAPAKSTSVLPEPQASAPAPPSTPRVTAASPASRASRLTLPATQ